MTAEKFPERSSSTVSAFILLSSSNFSFVKAWSTINPSRWWSVKLQIIIEWGLRCINGWRRRFIHRHFQIKPATNLHRTIKVILCARRKRFFMSQIFAVQRKHCKFTMIICLDGKKEAKSGISIPLSAHLFSDVLWWWTFFLRFVVDTCDKSINEKSFESDSFSF